MEKYYTLMGSQDFLDDEGFPRVESKDNKKIYAKSTLSKKPKNIVSKSNLGVDKVSYRYYISINSINEAYDPTNPNQPKASFIQRTCKSNSQFLEVNEYIFSKYINFLKSSNARWIKEINRDLK